MAAFNLLRGEVPNERDRPGYGGRLERVGDRLGSELIGGTVYELPAGERTFPTTTTTASRSGCS